MTQLVISKFAGLTRTEVVEQIDTTFEDWAQAIVKQPSHTYRGQFDEGGWSPAIYNPTTRALANVRRLFALVFDYDAGMTWDRAVSTWQTSLAVVYTTKSHGVDGERYRVVLALSRHVSAEEYARLWDWGAKLCAGADPQCKDASRFWYDPSLPPGGWKAQALTGKPIEVDSVLATLVQQPKLEVVRPAPPPSDTDRVRRAAAYLARIPGAVSGSGGHTATFNAVAHVMIGFDLSESDTLSLITADYNPRCDPPWSAKEIEHKIASVRKQCKRPRGYLLVDRPRVETRKAASEHARPLPADHNVDWASLLLVKKDHSPKRCYHNVAVFVRHFPEYRGRWTLDLMTDAPWFDDSPVSAALVHEIRAHADRRLGFTPGAEDVQAAICAAALERPFHPIRQYLESLDWDGVSRLSSMAHDYLGTDEPHHSEMLRRFMIGAVARAFRPGCKLDTALMLVGAQGIGKSTFFALLGGEWHADSFIDITQKDGLMQLHAAWIYELAELENVVHGSRESRLKAWMTTTHDYYRAPYAKTVGRKARSVVLCGTTNRDRFLTDDTGSRRFWIVPVNREIPRELLLEMRDQLWAEAVAAYEAGERWWLDRETDAVRHAANAEYQEEDSWLEPVSQWVTPAMCELSTTEVLRDALKIDVSRHDKAAQMRVGRVMRQLGWERDRRRSNGSQIRIWRRA